MFSILKKQRSSKVSIAGEPAILEIPRGKTLLEAMLAEGLAMPHDCKVGSCGTCRFKLMDGKIGELIPLCIDQNLCAHWRRPMDMMRQG
ncbi:2Fe-2S iron-sulfur cluster-binding protein [Novosphingobium soli]|uniref:2Fe-2S iron-sulfur cluster-binding protein n=1 Tax=Novosphingobium soli TaxID=574956 RepID=A0ABV6D227_9SPHN